MDKKFLVRILALTMVVVLVHTYLNREFLFSEADELDLNINTILELNSDSSGDTEETKAEEPKGEEEHRSTEEPKAEGETESENELNSEEKPVILLKSSDGTTGEGGEDGNGDGTGDGDNQEGQDQNGQEGQGQDGQNGQGGQEGQDGQEGQNGQGQEGQEGQNGQTQNGEPTGDNEDDKFTVTVKEGIENVAIQISNYNPVKDDTVSISATPDEGYSLKSLTVKTTDTESPADVALTHTDGNNYEFTQPEANVIIDASAEIVSYTIATPTTAQTECSIQIQSILKQPESISDGSTNACVGDKVVLAVTSKVGCVLSSITVTASTGNTIDAVKNFDNNYEFIMPAANIDSIVAVFTDFIILEEATKPFIVNANGNAIPQVGDRLTACTHALPNIQWKWYADDVFIEGATEQILVLTEKELGKTIRVQAIQPRNAAGEGRPGTDIYIMSDATPAVIAKVIGTITPEEVTAVTVYDYVNETINVTEAYELSLSDSVLEGQASLAITEILDREVNRVVYVRRKATDIAPASEWLPVFLSERPAAPTVSVENAVLSDWDYGKLVGTTAAMEYKLTSDPGFTRASDSYTRVKVGKYIVRYAASTTAFAGKTAEFTVRRQCIELTSQNKPVIVNITASRSQPVIGDTLEVQVNAGPGLSYQWYLNSSPISGATDVRYNLPASTYNKRISVRVTQAANVDGEGHPASAITASSDFVGPVKKVPGDSISESEIKGRLSYNYPMEVVAVSAGYEISTGSGSSGASSLKLTSVLDRNSAKYIYGRKKASDWQEASSWVKVSIPERPASPGNLTTESASSETAVDGKIIGTSQAMEYKMSGASSYTQASPGTTLVKAGTYFVRVAATGSNFASKYVTVKVESKTKKTDTTLKTKTTTKKSSKKSSSTKKETEEEDDEDLDFDLIDKSELWKTLSQDIKDGLRELLEESKGELVDANDLLDPTAIPGSKIAVNDMPIALVIGKGVIVIELDKIASGVILPDAYAVARGILTEEQIDLISRGGIVELKIATDSVIEDRIPAEEKAVFENSFTEYSGDYPNLTKAGYMEINISYKFYTHEWKEVTETLEPIEFVFELPDDLKNTSESFYMIRVHDGQGALLSDLDEDVNTVTICSTQFSNYLLVRTPEVQLATEEAGDDEADEKGNNPIKFFVTHQWPILFWGLVGLDVVYIAIRKIRKFRRNKRLATAK
ncbi:InlB B-repeat-containing protein [Pseudobutyrivibrio xylanivorans]|uniref:Bacterial repeat domain-containing protein n=1 Tax=Pseudobutyrivibrio xylanivorans DSM 14809 TaxID=1123012 RepID=A0A1M6CNQ0_PSEXY|nr:hypothetical protein [Pseudobutyrivibrio xylanivorans]SHI62481.1 hypothetical protein SAMN02745725_00766 [Pseudobutyrivibrio xylanivorans DSM 14809]